MKRLLLLCALLALILCGCQWGALPFPAPEATLPEVTTPEATTPEVTTPEPPTHKHLYVAGDIIKEPTCTAEGKREFVCECGAVTQMAVPATGKHSYGEAVITKEPTCTKAGESTITCTGCGVTEVTVIPATGKHSYGEAVITKEPTCTKAGESTITCTGCGATEVTVIPATGEHVYHNGKCSMCDESPIPLYAVPSAFDADGDGKTDTYNLSPQLLDSYKKGIHVWAGDYDKTLSQNPSTSSAGNVQHWYVTEFTAQTLIFKVTVPETGVYEMVINIRLKDAQVRGTKYTVNGGTDNEQVFETSYGYTGMNYTQMRDDTNGAYMYGVTVNLIEGENTIKIEHASDCPKSQHYRNFYFVKIDDYHAHKYQNETVTKPATCSESGEIVATCSCGKSRVTVIPPTYLHTYENGVCTSCGKEYIPAGITNYQFLYNKPGFAGGTVTFLPESTDVYTFYWANGKGKLANYSMLYSGEFTAEVEAELTIQSFTAIPNGATHLLAISGDGRISYSYTIPTERLLTAEELYVFGALSDTHQGYRYGSSDIPYDHFVNAAKILYDKGAIAIGICGDFSYDNKEFEYILHADALREIFAYAPTMPIFTTSGNHEAKYTGFSKDWYMKYTRDVVDYDSDLEFLFFDGNDLDYVIELPDGSVMIFFHQIYYDYGNSTSRLVTDEQLVWLEARLEQYKDRTVFFFFHTFMDEEVGDASTPGNEYGLPMISSTVEYKKFNTLFAKYKNVVYFSGHSHWAFDSQLVTPKPGKTNDDKNIDNRDGSFATMVHVPACSTPRVLVGSGDGRSEGYVIYVYNDCIVLQGYEFVKDEAFAYATYIIPKETTHTHSYTEEIITQAPTCNTVGAKTLSCSCGETQTVSIPATGEHTYANGICIMCGSGQEIIMTDVPSIYDADGDGATDIYQFSPTLLDFCTEDYTVHVWAGDYDKKLSSTVSTTTAGGLRHWYLADDGSQYIVYRVTVPEDGTYEMVLHFRMKDGQERGAKFIINEGTAFEQIFSTSHSFSGTDYEKVRDATTLSSYMYGVKVNLRAGENIIKIASATTEKSQHLRDFYFVNLAKKHRHVYEYEISHKAPTCVGEGANEFACACGEHIVAVLPATGLHIYADGFCTTCGQKDPGYGIIAYEYLFDAAGFAGGTVTVRTEKSGVFNLYWGNDEGVLPNYTMLCAGSFRAYVPSQITIHTQTAIPAGATRLLIVNSAGEVVYAYDIPAERQFNKTELYLFGAISDTHQGTRYGPENQSLDRLVNAGSILAEKGAILVGINGDIANANTEREYVLHGEALEKIFEVAPHMPVYSVSGNHEAKNIGFSRDWYIHYTREVVDYDTEYTPIFTEDNDLDFVVELPDGSVIIFLHQVYYDYGKTTSRLLDDYQLDWLGDRFEQYKDRTVFLFFHTEMEDKVGHFTAGTNLVMKKYTEDYKRLDAYFKEYTNVIFFSGHSHNSFDIVFDAELSSRVINTYGGEYATLVHIPSLADNIADGYVVHVYEDCIVFEGYEFENDEAFAYATFIIEK